MKVLYALQGTGNGHIARAREIIPILGRKADLDVLISGTQADIDLEHKVKYRMHGLSFVFGRRGGIDMAATLKNLQAIRNIRDIYALPVREYDLVINDFEPISAWAARLRRVPTIALSHQAAVLHPKAPKPLKTDYLAKGILKHYAPADAYFGFHFRRYGDHIFHPVIRSEIRQAQPADKGHFTIYLPAWGDDQIIDFVRPFNKVRWQIFSKHGKSYQRTANIEVFPIDNEGFIQSMVNATGVMCGAGFETPAEALFLGKKLFVVPMKGQYEQQCNAAALSQLGVVTASTLDAGSASMVAEWIMSDSEIPVDYKEETEKIIDRVLKIGKSLCHEK